MKKIFLSLFLFASASASAETVSLICNFESYNQTQGRKAESKEFTIDIGNSKLINYTSAWSHLKDRENSHGVTISELTMVVSDDLVSGDFLPKNKYVISRIDGTLTGGSFIEYNKILSFDGTCIKAKDKLF